MHSISPICETIFFFDISRLVALATQAFQRLQTRHLSNEPIISLCSLIFSCCSSILTGSATTQLDASNYSLAASSGGGGGSCASTSTPQSVVPTGVRRGVVYVLVGLACRLIHGYLHPEIGVARPASRKFCDALRLSTCIAPFVDCLAVLFNDFAANRLDTEDEHVTHASSTMMILHCISHIVVFRNRVVVVVVIV
jgi:hypothetical protein